MNKVSKHLYRNYISKTIIILTLFMVISSSYNTLDNLNIENKIVNRGMVSFSLGPTNDTTAPNIVFIQPAENYTKIKQYSYKFIVNITDDNPPLYGNVTIQISNHTHFLFNASMNFDGGKQWSYNWDNISLYPNYLLYIIRIWAKDSSSNENHNWSDDFYISLSISTGPSFLHFLLYIVAVSVIFSLIIVYVNKKARYRKPRKKKKKSLEIYDN